MNEYLFLYLLGFIAILFAVVQDLRTREIANWLTFSLISFALAYRAIYSIHSNNFMFFIYGLFGVGIFVVLGYFFYYSRVFAGGDAKLLFGLGAIFPYESILDYIYYGLGFILLLFTGGIVYTLFYSLFLVRKNYSSFKILFFKEIKNKRYFFIASSILAIIAYFTKNNNDSILIIGLFSFFIFLSPFLFVYVRAVEKSCMVKFVSPKNLTEGDWLERDVSINGKIIHKNFSGLTFKEIMALRRKGKSVLVKNGVPFAPAFLIAFTLIIIIILRYSSLKPF